MTTVAVISSNPLIDEATAERIVTLWNAAYPGMRELLTTVIDAQRNHLRENPDSRLQAEIKRHEETRRVLGQLDRGTYRGCTRSPGMFDTWGALSAIKRLPMPTGSKHGGSVYRLAAELSDVEAARTAAWPTA
ncbi:hypothetical protein [Streptomyces sp. 1222.5]|uniref:hypothetical protein n=1 Tax=Streptomyces sp. 1222.5 TaxID=1881026 RepID=UPI003D7298B4